MSRVTALLYCYRLPTLAPSEFRTYIEGTHVPLVQSLLRRHHPLTHTRYYTDKDSGYVLGSSSAEDPDLIAVIEYESEEALRLSMQMRFSDGIREVIQADEDRFMERGRTKVIVLGSEGVGKTVREAEGGVS